MDPYNLTNKDLYDHGAATPTTGAVFLIVAIVVVTTMTMSTLTITKFLRKGIQDGWAAARALATEYNDQYMHDS